MSDVQSKKAIKTLAAFGIGVLNEVIPVARHADLTSVAEDRLLLKLVRFEQNLHAVFTLLAVGNGVLNEVSPLDSHALVKFTLFASVPSFAPAGNDVRDEQDCHADVKFEQVFMSVVLKLLSPEQPYHAKRASVTSGRSTENASNSVF